MTGKGDFHSSLLSLAARQPGSRKNPRQVDRRGFEKRIQTYRFTKNVAPFSSGLATFLAAFSFSQQEDCSAQAVWALVPHPAFSEQVILGLLVTFALSALAALLVAEDLRSPARATGSEARQANVKQTINFFITVSGCSIVTTRTFQ